MLTSEEYLRELILEAIIKKVSYFDTDDLYTISRYTCRLSRAKLRKLQRFFALSNIEDWTIGQVIDYIKKED